MECFEVEYEIVVVDASALVDALIGKLRLSHPAIQPYDHTSSRQAELRRHLRQPPNLHISLQIALPAHTQDAGMFKQLLDSFQGPNSTISKHSRLTRPTRPTTPSSSMSQISS